MSTPATPPAASVHWTQPGLRAKVEREHGDECGPIVILDYLALYDPAHWPLNSTGVNTVRQFALDDGNMDTPQYVGMTISSIADELTRRYHIAPVKVAPYDANLDFNTFRSDLINALLAHQLVIMETSNAAALPDNQPGVQYHFVLFGGIDSTLGYLTCNGDTETALRSASDPVAPVWYTRADLAASQPCGYLILPTLDKPAAPPPPDVKGALAALATAQAALADAVKKLEL